MALDSPPAIIVIDKEGDISDCPSIATMPAETQAYMKNHQLREYKVQRYEISPDGNTEYTLSLRAISPQDLINFPLGSYLCTLEFWYPSEIKIFPVLKSTAVCVHLLKGIPLNGLDGFPGFPIVINTFPSRSHCLTE